MDRDTQRRIEIDNRLIELQHEILGLEKERDILNKTQRVVVVDASEVDDESQKVLHHICTRLHTAVALPVTKLELGYTSTYLGKGEAWERLHRTLWSMRDRGLDYLIVENI